MKTMNANDIQQSVSGFKTVAVIPGPVVVRVHEALDSVFQGEKSRYFISVDFKFPAHQALNIGKPGCLGCTKSEATRDANALAAKVFNCYKALAAANELALKWDTFTNRYTVKLQQDAWDKIVGRYNSEFV